MPTVTPTYPVDDTTAEVADYNTIIQSILAIFNGNLDGDNFADGAITAAKLDDGAVASAKIADGAITTAKVSDGAVTAAKIDFTTFPAVTTDANGWAVYSYANFTQYRRSITLGNNSMAYGGSVSSSAAYPVGIVRSQVIKSSLDVSNTTDDYGDLMGMRISTTDAGITIYWSNLYNSTRTMTGISATVCITI